MLPNRNGDPVPVLKVRSRVILGNAVQIKSEGNKYVNPRNNHHVLIYEDLVGNLQQDIITFWEVVERKRKGQPVFQMPNDGKKIITSLQTNDCFILGMEDKSIDWNNLDYKTIKDQLGHVDTKNINESVDKVVNNSMSSGSSQNLIESKTYENPQFLRIKDLMSKI